MEINNTGNQTESSPTSERVEELLENRTLIALVRRDDLFEEVSSRNPFESQDLVMIILRSKRLDEFKRQFHNMYVNNKPFELNSNLPEGFILILCGRLPHGKLFDPLGQCTRHTANSSFKLSGGILTDSRSNLFLAGYPPEMICDHNGKALSAVTNITVNGRETRLDEFLSSLKNIQQLAAFTINIEHEEIRFDIASHHLDSSVYHDAIGFSIRENTLSYMAIALDETEPSLQGTVLNYQLNEGTTNAISEIDLLLLLEQGDRISLPQGYLTKLLCLLERLKPNNVLINIAINQIKLTNSIPVKAIASTTLRQLISIEQPI